MVTIDLYSACNIKPSREESLTAIAKLFAPREARTNGKLELEGLWPGGCVGYRFSIAGHPSSAVVYAEMPSIYEGIIEVFSNSIKPAKGVSPSCTFCINGELIEFPIYLQYSGKTEEECVNKAITELVPKACEYLKKIENIYLDAIMNE